jgi:SH3-like domain-containing protein
MKINHALILATLVSTSVLAQSPAPTPAAVPAPADTSPTPAAPVPPDTGTAPKAKKTAKKKTVKKKAAPAAAAAPSSMPGEPIMANQAAAAKQDNINVRGQARINSEVVGHLKKGEVVNVLEIVTLPHPKTDEPAKWARIAMPESMHVWVNSSYIDSGAQTVKAKKLNLRSGPGENFSVIGQLHQGDAVKTITTKGDWTELSPPAGSFAFVAAHLLEPSAAAAPTPLVSSPTPSPIPTPVPVPAPAPTPTVVENSGTIAAAPTGNPGNSGEVAPAPIPAPAPVPAPAPAASDEPLPKRIIEREGIVGGMASIQSPSHFTLKSLDNGRTMDYLYTTSTNLVLTRYKGLTVLVTGEESLDERWPDTPVLTIQKIQVVK